MLFNFFCSLLRIANLLCALNIFCVSWIIWGLGYGERFYWIVDHILPVRASIIDIKCEYECVARLSIFESSTWINKNKSYVVLQNFWLLAGLLFKKIITKWHASFKCWYSDKFLFFKSHGNKHVRNVKKKKCNAT